MHKLESIANTDIYLIDQILKNRFHENDRILMLVVVQVKI